MKIIRSVSLYQILLSTILFMVILGFVVVAQPEGSSEVVILASVEPQRTIIVDKDNTIQQIYSNTNKDIRPLVYIGGFDGEETAYTDSVRSQYEAIKKTSDFSAAGKIYQRPLSPAGSIFHTIVNFFKRILGF